MVKEIGFVYFIVLFFLRIKHNKEKTNIGMRKTSKVSVGDAHEMKSANQHFAPGMFRTVNHYSYITAIIVIKIAIILASATAAITTNFYIINITCQVF